MRKLFDYFSIYKVVMSKLTNSVEITWVSFNYLIFRHCLKIGQWLPTTALGTTSTPPAYMLTQVHLVVQLNDKLQSLLISPNTKATLL